MLSIVLNHVSHILSNDNFVGFLVVDGRVAGSVIGCVGDNVYLVNESCLNSFDFNVFRLKYLPLIWHKLSNDINGFLWSQVVWSLGNVKVFRHHVNGDDAVVSLTKESMRKSLLEEGFKSYCLSFSTFITSTYVPFLFLIRL